MSMRRAAGERPELRDGGSAPRTAHESPHSLARRDKLVLAAFEHAAPVDGRPLTGATGLGWRRSIAAFGLSWGTVCAIACGDGETSAVPGVVDPCTPHLTAGWAPRWKPPRAPDASACTDDQISTAFLSCDGPRSTAAACQSFRDNPVHEECRACLYSKETDPSYGPIIRLDNGSWKTNTAGCIALVDGDGGEDGCAAKIQAASACNDAACSQCLPFDAYAKCKEGAMGTVCRPFYLDSVCLRRPAHAICTEWPTSADFFLAAGKFFCGTPPVAPIVDPATGAP